MTIRISFMVLAVAVLSGNMAAAHNLFVRVERQSDGPDRINVIFEHAPFPGNGQHNGPIIERGRTWVRTADGEKPAPHKLSEITRRSTKFLQGETNTSAPRAIEHSCLWGIYHGQLDYFHGKYLDVTTADQARQLGRATDLPLDLVPQATGDTLAVQVLWQGKPQGGVTVHVWPPGGRERKYRANDAGLVTLPKATSGTYSFSTVLRFPDEKGEFAGQSYQGLMHGVTLTIPWPLN
jgi:hypothetical protein